MTFMTRIQSGLDARCWSRHILWSNEQAWPSAISWSTDKCFANCWSAPYPWPSSWSRCGPWSNLLVKTGD